MQTLEVFIHCAVYPPFFFESARSFVLESLKLRLLPYQFFAMI